MKKLIYAQPKTLSQTEEHRIVKRKWWAVLILIAGGILLAGRLPVPMFLPMCFSFLVMQGCFIALLKNMIFLW